MQCRLCVRCRRYGERGDVDHKSADHGDVHMLNFLDSCVSLLLYAGIVHIIAQARSMDQDSTSFPHSKQKRFLSQWARMISAGLHLTMGKLKLHQLGYWTSVCCRSVVWAHWKMTFDPYQYADSRRFHSVDLYPQIVKEQHQILLAVAWSSSEEHLPLTA